MAESAKVKINKGWFKGLGRDGDRTLDQQMLGLEQVVREVRGKTVLDVGCAEGLIALQLAADGAASCHGMEIVPRFVDIANGLAAERGLPCTFEAANLNDFDLSGVAPADIVLLLSILHKTQDPSKVCGALADKAKDLCVVRLPPSGPRIVDERSGNIPHDIADVMAAKGFDLEATLSGPMSEWLGYFRRKPAAAAPPPVETNPDFVETQPVEHETTHVEPETKAPEPETPPAQDGVAHPVDPTPSTTEPVGVNPAEGSVESGPKLFPAETARGRRARGDNKGDQSK